MLAAEDVRRAFIRTVMAGKKHTRTASAWALARLVTRDRTVIHRLSDPTVAVILANLLGQEHSPDSALTDAPTSRHPMLLWAIICAVYESVMPKDIWRRAASSRIENTAYLEHLVELGYTPCDTEQLMISGTAANCDSGDTGEDEHAQDDLTV